MSVFKRFTNPNAEEKAKAEAFKQALKYGSDIGGAYQDAKEKHHQSWKKLEEAKKAAENAMIKQLGLTFKNHWNNANSIYIRDYSNRCTKSPVRYCVTILEFGHDNPSRDDPQNCFYCNKVFKK